MGLVTGFVQRCRERPRIYLLVVQLKASSVNLSVEIAHLFVTLAVVGDSAIDV